MNETAALEVTAVRAVETADGARGLWTDADRAWASRAAAEVVGETAAPAKFLARRARLALERLGERYRSLPRAVAALRWRPWVGHVLVVAGFLLGVAVDRVGGSQRINLLAPPMLLLIAWNLAIYAALAIGFVVRFGDTADVGPLRRFLTRFSSGARAMTAARAEPVAAAIARFTTEWSTVAAPLYGARAARILHIAAAALALGVMAGLYLRGLAFEYRATWESTFLTAPSAHAILKIALAPGAFVTGISVPGVDAIAAMQAPGSENAARWLHLMVATMLVVIVLPRCLLALGAWLRERYHAQRIPVPLDDLYFARLLRGFRGGVTRMRVVPYSFTPAPASVSGLEAVLGRCFGGSTALTVTAPFAYGQDDEQAVLPAAIGDGPVIMLFNLTATPEQDVHGAFAKAIRIRAGAGQPALAMVDESSWLDRWPLDHARRDERRSAWREVLAQQQLTPVFVQLGAPDLTAAEAAIEAALATSAEPYRSGAQA